MSEEPVEDYSETPAEEYVEEPAEGGKPNVESGADGNAGSDEGGTPQPEDRKPDYKKMFEDTKKAYTQTAMEAARLRGMVEGVQSRQQPAEPEKDWLEDVDDELLKADPSKVKDIIKRQRKEFADVMRMRDSYLLTEMDKRSPEVFALKQEIDELRTDPELEGFSDKQLAVLAKKKMSVTAGGEKPPTAVPSGTRIVREKTVDPKSSPLFREIYGNQFDKKEVKK